MRRSLATFAALTLVLLLTAGCGDNDPTGPNPGIVNQTTADDLALQAITSLSVVSGDVQVAVSSTPMSGANLITRGAPFGRAGAPMRALTDTTFMQGGVTFEASRDFYDAMDNVLPGYGPTAVRLSWNSRAYGTYEGPRDTATVGHGAALDLRGIQTGQDTLRFDGGCYDSLENRFRSYDGTRTRYFFWTSTTNIDAVRILKSSLQTGGGTPISGTVTITVSADRLRSNNRVDVEAHFDATLTVTFVPNGMAVITVNGRFYYNWNLFTGEITRV